MGSHAEKGLAKRQAVFKHSECNALNWKTLLTGKYTFGNCRDRQKKSFLFLPPFPQKCKSWEGLIFLARTQPWKLWGSWWEEGCRQRATAFSPVRRDGPRLTSKAPSLRHAMAATVTKETAPDNPGWKHPHPVSSRKACPLKMLRMPTELASFHYTRTDNTIPVKVTQ